MTIFYVAMLPRPFSYRHYLFRKYLENRANQNSKKSNNSPYVSDMFGLLIF